MDIVDIGLFKYGSRTNVIYGTNRTIRGLGVMNSSWVLVDIVGGCFCVVRNCLRRLSEGKASRRSIDVAVMCRRQRSVEEGEKKGGLV